MYVDHFFAVSNSEEEAPNATSALPAIGAAGLAWGMAAARSAMALLHHEMGLDAASALFMVITLPWAAFALRNLDRPLAELCRAPRENPRLLRAARERFAPKPSEMSNGGVRQVPTGLAKRTSTTGQRALGTWHDNGRGRQP